MSPVRHGPPGLLLVFALAVLLVPGEAEPRRMPGGGGEASVAMPASLREVTVAAHTSPAIVRPVPPGEHASRSLSHPPLTGIPWRSDVLRSLVTADEGRNWLLVSKVDPASLEASLRDCLTSEEGPSWPAAALRAAHVTVAIGREGEALTLQFDRPFGPTPELLAGCLAPGLPGAFAAGPRGTLTARADAPGGAPLLGTVTLRDPGSRADLSTAGRGSSGGGALVTEAPDVVLLVLGEQAREADPLDLSEGLERFRQLFAPELLLEVFWEGRGSATAQILPVGIAPSRPLPPLDAGSEALALRLDPLPANAPRLAIVAVDDDALLGGVSERLAVLLRSRGWAVDDSPDHRAEVVRWNPPTLDPALALLSLAGERPELFGEARVAAALSDPRLVGPDRADRLEQALLIERSWIEERRVIPLMTADRWVRVDPALRGVRLRPDGVPLLHDAWWESPR